MPNLHVNCHALCRFVTVAGCVAILLSTINHARASDGFAIIQGATDPTTTQIAVLAEKDTTLEIVLHAEAKGPVIAPLLITKFTRPYSQWQMTRVLYHQLEPHKEYHLRVRDSNGTTDQRILQTFDPGDKLRFALVSCMDDTYQEQKQMWTELLSQRPNFIIFMGDNVYGDVANGKLVGRPVPPETLWQRYVETRQTLEIFRSERLTPIIATWDDHDFGFNDGNMTYPWVEESRKLFTAFFPQTQIARSDQISHGPGIARKIKFGKQDFFLLDDRSFRTPVGQKGKSSHFGDDQESWLFCSLVHSPRPTWLINGGQFFGAYHEYESFAGQFSDNFQSFMKTLKQIKRPVVFASGDRHLSELMRIPEVWLGYETYEITSSGIHAKTYLGAWKKHGNPLQIEGRSGVLNYTVVQSRLDEAELWQIVVTAYSQGTKKLYERKLTVSSPIVDKAAQNELRSKFCKPVGGG